MASIKPVRLDYKLIEPPTKRNKCHIILLHGLTSTKASFLDIADDLAIQTGRRVYMLDARNHGDSEHSNIFHFDAMAVDVINFMDEHDIKTASFFGHSMGGRLAMIMALNYPDRVENIIVEDMTPKGLSEDIVNSASEFTNFLQESINIVPDDADIEEATKAFYMHILPVIAKDTQLKAEQLNLKLFPLNMVKRDGKFIWKTNFPVIMKELENLKLTENLQGLCRKPALFIYGMLSEFKVGDDKDFILDIFPKAHLHGLPTSHIVHIECVSESLQAVKEFLE